MSGPIKGYPSKKRDLSLGAEDTYITGAPQGNDKHGLDVNAQVFATETADTQPIDAISQIEREDGSKVWQITSTGTTAKEGDILRFDTGARSVVQSVSGDDIELGTAPDPLPTTSNTFSILTPNTPVVNADGELALDPGPIQFTKDGSTVEVTEDTVTPGNNIPLPVKLTSITGDINITANDLNVQTSHSAANPDSMQIGDGTEILEITASGQAQTFDSETHTKLDTLEASLASMELDLESIDSELDTQTTLLTSLDGKDFATETTLGSIDTELLDQGTTLDDSFARLQLIDAKLGVINGKMDDLVQEAVWTARIGQVSATPDANTVLGRLKDIDDAIGSLSGTDFATETTLSALNAKVTAVDTTGKATEAKQDDIITNLATIESDIETGNVTLASIDGKDFATQTTLAALLTELEAKADLSETQPVSAASLPLPAGAATETKQDTIITNLGTIETDIETLVTQTSDVATETSLAAQAADIALLEDRLGGDLVPEAFDFIELTYVAAGNGEGEVETATYKTGGAAGTTVATLTLAYDASNRLTSVTKA